MMDLLMLGMLGICIGLIALLIHWCGRQVDAQE